MARLRPSAVGHPVAVDALLAVIVAIATLVMVFVADRFNARPPDLLGYLLAGSVAVPILTRRRYPIAVLVATYLLLHLYYALDYPSIEPAVPLAVPLYSAAMSRRARWSWLIAAWTVVSSVVMFRLHEHLGFEDLAGKVVDEGALLLVVLLLARGAVIRRIRLAEAHERLALAEREREQETARQVADERLRIARDVHDIVAHTISVITIQAGVAEEKLVAGPPEARTAVGTIRASAREAMAQLRVTVGVLRAGDPDGATPAPGMAELGQLFQLARDAGLRVRTEVPASVAELPSHLQVVVYRIVQEALTNAVRHAAASTVTVTIGDDGQTLTVDVLDDGGRRGRVTDADRLGNVKSGNGLVGMTERAHIVNGSLAAGPVASGGFLVSARLPSAAGNRCI